MSTPNPKQIAAFYHFQSVPADQLDALSETLEKAGNDMGLRGLIIFATEGMNGTISGETREAVLEWLKFASETLGFPAFSPKWSEAPEWPFKRFGVRQRPEIVTLGKPEVQPLPPKSQTHLSPTEWDNAIDNEDVVVVDTRNWYEYKIGTFKKALDPKIEEFSEFSDYVAQSGIPKEKKVLIFCTGGIRCEKAIVEMHNQGYDNVYQLDGGILNYLAEKPNKNFEGECFVFDTRVAVDQNLQPSTQYGLCPHCGQPADKSIECLRCDTSALVCVSCSELEEAKNTCSKNCAHHYRVAPGKKGKPQAVSYKNL